MQTIKNQTRKVLSVPLPRGKRLVLGPGKTGQITSKAIDHPPLVALVDAGELEMLGQGASVAGRNGSANPTGTPGQNQNFGKTVFRAGDG